MINNSTSPSRPPILLIRHQLLPLLGLPTFTALLGRGLAEDRDRATRADWWSGGKDKLDI